MREILSSTDSDQEAAGVEETKINGLKPCPFCGSNVIVWETAYGVVKVVECKTCDIRFVFPWSKTETGKDLADKWNRRQQEQEKQEE